MRTTLLFVFALLCSATSFAQLNLVEDFEGSIPSSWTNDGSAATTATSCDGQSIRDNIWSSSQSGSSTSPAVPNATADETTVSFDYKIVAYAFGGSNTPADAGFGEVELLYAINGGSFVSLWTTTTPVGGPCITETVTIPANTFSPGDDVIFQFQYSWSGDDWHIYLDNFSATQPGACVAGAATYTVIEDCANSGGFSIDVDVTDFGTATTISFADDQGGAAQVANAGSGTLTFGPYTNGTDVTITGTPNDDAACSITSSTLTQDACPPDNDECAGAIALVCNDPAINGTTVGATDNADVLGCTQGPAVWYSFVGMGLPVTVTADPDNSSYDIELAIATGDCSGGFTNVDCADTFDDEVITFTPDNGVTYYVAVGHFSTSSTTTGTFTIELACESCANPEATFAVIDDCAASGGFFVDATITALGSATSVTVSDGNEDQQAFADGTTLTFGPYTNGTDVTITVTNDQDGTCTVTSSTLTQAGCPPANDECMGAPVIVVGTDGLCSGAETIDLNGATDSPNNPSCDNTGTNLDVWFSFTAPESGEIDFSTTSTLIEIAVFDDCAQTTELFCTTAADGARVTGLVAGASYILNVWQDDFNVGAPFDLCLEEYVPPAAPENDLCDRATELICNGPAVDGTTVSATDNADGVGCSQGPAVWYTLVGTGLPVTLTAAPESGYDIEIAVATGDCAGGFTSVTCADGFFGTETLTFTPDAGVTYYVTIGDFDDSSTSTGMFTLELTCESCSNPTATFEVVDDCANSGGFAIEATITDLGSATSVTVSDGTTDLQTSTTGTPLTFGPYTNGDDITITVTNDQDGTCSRSSGVLTQEVCPPANDGCAGAIALTDANGGPTAANGAEYDTNGATASSTPATTCQGFTGNADDDIWFTVTAPAGGGDIITIVVDGTTNDEVIVLFSGDCGNLTEVACADTPTPETITYTVPEARGAVAETFYVQVYDYSPGGGTFNVTATVQSILPVELTAFNGQTMEKANKLTWTTAREEALDRYIVERAAAGGEQWSAIGEVTAAGDSDTELAYELMDETPLASSLYRLKMVDLDGSFEYSNIVQLDNSSTLNNQLSVFPVPTNSDVTVSFLSKAAGNASVSLTDLTGRTLNRQTVAVSAGINTEQVDLSTLKPGIYLVRVNVDGRQLMQRVVRQ